jgi:uncharacterized protein YbaP (TraB family)
MRCLILVAALVSFPFTLAAESASAREAEAATPASEAPSTAPSIARNSQLMDAVVVAGEQPGPGLWRVYKDDDHVLYILGTISPLPKKMTWLSKEVENTLAQSQELLHGPSVGIVVERNMFRVMMLVPALLGARNNPDKQKLVDVLPAELHARWLVLKQKYIGRSRSVERRRPILAAQKLYSEAIKDVGLTEKPQISPLVLKAAKRHDLVETRPSIMITIEHPRAMLKDLSKTTLDDVECFGKTLDHLETDIGTMALRANAWATGDIDALRDLPFVDAGPACIKALLDAPVIQANGLADSEARARAEWLAAAEAALGKNASTFAMLPMGQLLKPDGYLEALRVKGYEIEEP